MPWLLDLVLIPHYIKHVSGVVPQIWHFYTFLVRFLHIMTAVAMQRSYFGRQPGMFMYIKFCNFTSLMFDFETELHILLNTSVYICNLCCCQFLPFLHCNISFISHNFLHTFNSHIVWNRAIYSRCISHASLYDCHRNW